MEDVCGVEVPEPIRGAAPAPLLRRVDREPRAPRLHAPRARLPRLRRRRRARPRRARGRRARAGAEEDRQRGARRSIGGREIHPINVRVGGFYRAPTRRELRTLVDPLERAREAALETVRWTAGFDFPERAVECELVALSEPGDVRDRARPDRLRPRPRHRVPPSTTSTSSRSTSSARTRSTRAGATAAPTSAARSRATRSTATALSPLALEAAREAGRRAAVPRRLPQHRRAQRRARLRVRRGPAPDRGVRGAGRARRRRSSRVAGVGYGVSEAPRGPALPPLPARRRRARSSTRRSCRRRRRTSSRSRTTCAPSSSATPSSPTTSCAALCEQAIRNYDPCISCATHFLDLEVERRVSDGRASASATPTAATTPPASRSPSAYARVAPELEVRRVRAGADPAARRLGGSRPRARRRRGRRRARSPARCTASTRPSSPFPRRVFRVVDARVRRRRGRRARDARSGGCPTGSSSSGSRARRSAPATSSPPAVAAAVEPLVGRARSRRRDARARADAGPRRGRSSGSAAPSGASRVTRVDVRLGALSHFTPEHFREHFEDASRGTLAEGAAVHAELDSDVPRAPARRASSLESVEVEATDVPRRDRPARRGLGGGRHPRRPARRRRCRLARLRPRRACRRPPARPPRRPRRGARARGRRRRRSPCRRSIP